MRTSEKWLLLVFLLCFVLASPLAAQQERLRVLAATGTAQEIQAALQKGADFNDHDWAGVTALMAAAGNNHNADVIPVLLRYGAVVDARDRNGETALMFAAERNGDPAVIAALLTGGAGLEMRDKFGRTPLLYAAKCNPSLEVVIALLKAGASVNARDSYGMSPLLYAAWLGQTPAIVSALLSAGADAEVRSVAGPTLLEFAEENPVLMRDTRVLHQLQEAMKGTKESAEPAQRAERSGARMTNANMGSICQDQSRCHVFNIVEKNGHGAHMRELYCEKWPERCRTFQTQKTGAPVPITLWPDEKS